MIPTFVLLLVECTTHTVLELESSFHGLPASLPKAERESQKLAKAAAEAQEMRDIMARLDNRGSTLKKR